MGDPHVTRHLNQLRAAHCRLAPRPNIGAVARRWSITLGHAFTPAQVVFSMIDLKLTHLGHDPRHQDSILNLASYSAALREVTR